MRSILRPTALLLVVLLSACSWSTMTPPPRTLSPADPPPVCTKTRLAPVADTVAAGALGIFALVTGLFVLAASSISEESPGGQALVPIGLLVGSGVFAASAFTGFGRAEACRDAGFQYEVLRAQAARSPGAAPAGATVVPASSHAAPSARSAHRPSPGTPPPGTERGSCRPDGGCDRGLTCASQTCVRLP